MAVRLQTQRIELFRMAVDVLLVRLSDLICGGRPHRRHSGLAGVVGNAVVDRVRQLRVALGLDHQQVYVVAHGLRKLCGVRND